MSKLWQKGWELNKTVETFETQGDLVLDQKLLKYDVWGSIAHALGLVRIGILSGTEFRILFYGLKEILALNAKNQFQLVHGDEDIHSKIENYLTDKYGNVGKKIHTGRSRNDQVLTAIRLFTKDQIFIIWEAVLELINELLIFAKKHEQTIFPGYTHMQRAMPSSAGMWAGALAEGLLDDLMILKATYDLNNQSPLGSAAAYGIPLDLDRAFTAEKLGFQKVQVNSLYCQNSRGKIESLVLAALINVLQEINKFSTDILLFSTTEFGFFEIDKTLCSGSSIMPQKKNVDIAELLRSKVHLVLGNYTQLVSLSANLPSGYNRDLQDTKKPLFESLEITLSSLQVAKILLKGIAINTGKIEAAMTPEIFATHHALKLVKEGTAFRTAYQKAGQKPKETNYESAGFLNESKHLGGTGNLGLDHLQKQYKHERKSYLFEKHQFEFCINSLMKGDDKDEE